MRERILALVSMMLLSLIGCTSTSTVKSDVERRGGAMMVYVNPVRDQYEYLKKNFAGYNPFLLYENVEDVEGYVRHLIETDGLPSLSKREHELMIFDMGNDWFVHLYPTVEAVTGYIVDALHEIPEAYFILNKETGAITHYATKYSNQ